MRSYVNSLTNFCTFLFLLITASSSAPSNVCLDTLGNDIASIQGDLNVNILSNFSECVKEELNFKNCANQKHQESITKLIETIKPSNQSQSAPIKEKDTTKEEQDKIDKSILEQVSL